MFYVLSRRLLSQANTCRIPKPKLSSLQIPCCRSRNPNTHFDLGENSYSRFITTTPNSQDSTSSSFTVSYLVNSCGLSPEAALKAAKKLHLKTPDNPDSVLDFFKNNGFTKPQITKLVTQLPTLLVANPKKTLDPKLQFLKQVGFSKSDIPKLLASATAFLLSSLEHRILPSFQMLKSLLHTEEDVALAIKNSLGISILRTDLHKVLLPKVVILRDHGVPESNIKKFIVSRHRVLPQLNTRFAEVVSDVLQMGINPSSKMFVHALRALTGINKAKLFAKWEIYRSFGWSDDEILLAIRRQPTCIAVSEKKLRIGLDFFMNKMNWEPAYLVKAPNILGLSLEKRIIPRLTVIQFLISKGLNKKGTHITTALLMTDASFITNFLAKYEDKVPEILHLYHGKL